MNQAEIQQKDKERQAILGISRQSQKITVPSHFSYQKTLEERKLKKIRKSLS